MVWPRDRGVRVHRSGSELGLYMRLVGEEDERGAERDRQRCTANQTSPRAHRTRATRRLVVGPCVLLSLGWMDVALQPSAVLCFRIDTRVHRSCLHAQLQVAGAVAAWVPERGITRNNWDSHGLGSPAFKI